MSAFNITIYPIPYLNAQSPYMQTCGRLGSSGLAHGPSRLPAPTARCVELSFVRERLPGYLQANFGPQIVMETRRRGDGGSAEAAPIALSQRKRVRRYSL
jgi:hypothetical protein